MTSHNTLLHADAIAKQIIADLAKMFLEYKDRKVWINKGKYTGYKAQITNITIDNGRVLFLCYVIKRNGSGFLNSDGETRQYRSVDEIELIGEENV